MSAPSRAVPAAVGVRHLYVHVPFCRSRCAYCDFASEPVGPHQRSGGLERYLERLEEELDERASRLADSLETVYVGGGTPTALDPDRLRRLLGLLRPRLGPGGELTVEANPRDLTAELVEALVSDGVTRVSLGVQSFDSRLRRTLGRRTGDVDIDRALAALRGSSLESWSLDLVFGIPGQSLGIAFHDVDAALSAGAPHVSLYDLTYTPAYAGQIAAREGQDALHQAEEFAEEAYSAVVDRLEEGGLTRYEVSNFARSGHESRHNLAYWHGRDYVGLGPSAVSTVGFERTRNPETVADYLSRTPAEVEILDEGTRAFERAMLGLRTAEGVGEEEVAGVLDRGPAERLAGEGFIEWGYGRLRLTRRGLDLSNAVLASILK